MNKGDTLGLCWVIFAGVGVLLDAPDIAVWSALAIANLWFAAGWIARSA